MDAMIVGTVSGLSHVREVQPGQLRPGATRPTPAARHDQARWRWRREPQSTEAQVRQSGHHRQGAEQGVRRRPAGAGARPGRNSQVSALRLTQGLPDV